MDIANKVFKANLITDKPDPIFVVGQNIFEAVSSHIFGHRRRLEQGLRVRVDLLLRDALELAQDLAVGQLSLQISSYFIFRHPAKFGANFEIHFRAKIVGE